MSSMKKNIAIFILFIGIFTLIYISLTLDKDQRVKEQLEDEAKYLQISYNQGIDRFHVIAENVYISLQNDDVFLKIFADYNKNGMDTTHTLLYEHIKDEFIKLQHLGVMGLQIVLPNNESLLRMHKIDKYGDDLTPVRYSLDYVNKNKTHLHGFEEGRTSHAFRELYPIFRNGKFLGTLEILFSSTLLQDYTMRASNIHTHFLVNKNVFEVNAWKSKLVEPYKQSFEHSDFLYYLNDHIESNRLNITNEILIKPLRKEIDKGIATKKMFEVYKQVDDEMKIITFLPIKRIKDEKVVAYLVSYTCSNALLNTIKRYNSLVLLLCFVALIVGAGSIVFLRDKERMNNELQYDFLTGILNRNHFVLHTKEHIKNAKRASDMFTIVMGDIDFFKSVNDTFGHQYGDIVLQEFAKILKSSIRTQDLVARYGGEEFVLFLTTDTTSAFKILEAIREKVQKFEFGIQNVHITASFGITQVRKDEDIENSIKRADDALYIAKNSGRNQTKIV